MRHVANREREVIAHVHRGLLRIDNDGSIWRVARLFRLRPQAAAIEPRRAEIVNHRGYLKIQVHNASGGNTYCFAHRLVWQHFYGDIPEGMEVNHKDLIKSNNHPLNLELIPHLDNMHHAAKAGRMSWRSVA